MSIIRRFVLFARSSANICCYLFPLGGKSLFNLTLLSCGCHSLSVSFHRATGVKRIMNRSRRKSTFGTGNTAKLGFFPVRLDMRPVREKSPLGTGKCGVTPSPTNLLDDPLRPRLGMGRSGGTPSPTYFLGRHDTSRPRLGMGLTNGITPIRPADVSSAEASIYFSIKKSQKSPKSPKTRRRLNLNLEGPQNNEEHNGPKSVATSSKPAVRSLRKPVVRAFPEKSRIPKPPSVQKGKPVTRSQTAVSSQGSSTFLRATNSRKTMLPTSTRAFNGLKASTSGQSKAQADVFESQQRVLQDLKEGLQEQRNMLQEQRDILQEMKMIKSSVEEQTSLLQEQKNILQEMKTVKSSVEEQTSLLLEAKDVFSQILHDQRSILDEHRKLLDEAKSSSVHKFTSDEKAVSNLYAVDTSKENLPASEAAYRQMRRSFRCLGTPTLSCSSKKARTPQIKTPRTSLSNKVRAQLHNLLDS
ncbi:uncharacterized protein LOC117647791 [Thrips palmi]|uniref:Uncharacterized protein LOC117647791 n=1 Tax=Thrips palmi TaxID=161013 RepID=A0A6P8YZN7_THRPL|nr:uncharacterized protein LOC117647791 [Thrips palmi]